GHPPWRRASPPAAGSARSGRVATVFCFQRLSGRVSWMSPVTQSHALANLIEGLARRFPRLLATLINDATNQLRVVFIFLGPFEDGDNLLHDFVDERLLSVQAPDAGAAAAVLYPFPHLLVRVDLVQIPDRAFLRLARIGAE